MHLQSRITPVYGFKNINLGVRQIGDRPYPQPGFSKNTDGQLLAWRSLSVANLPCV